MRDVALLAVLMVLWPMALRRPWIGIMTWVWVSLMVPQAQTFGFMLGAPVAMVTAIVTLVGVLVSREQKSLPLASPVLLLLLFSAWVCVTYFFSLVPTSENLAQLDKVMKIYLFTFVTILVLHTRRQVDILIAVLALSVAYFGVKGGIFTVLTGGAFRVRGEGGFLHGNNEVGLGMLMTVPLLYYLARISDNVWMRRGLWVVIVLNVVATLGTQSRGALVGIAAMGAAFIVRSDRPFRLIPPVVVLAIGVLAFMPDSWWDRMETIGQYRQDESAMGRLNAWMMAYNLARDNFFGGGFYIESQNIFDRYAPNPQFIAVAHSIYFQVLGQHGFVGLAIFVLFWMATIKQGWWISKHSPDPKDLLLARMVEVSLVGYFTGAAFLNLAYFDGPYYLMAALVILRYKVLRNTPKARSAGKQVQQPSTAGGQA